MEKYIAPEMEVVEFDNEDVIVTSGCDYCDQNLGDGGNED